MRYHALAADYDGTLAHHGLIDDGTWAALRRFRESGRKLVMVTGRRLDELLPLLQEPKLFDRIVAENGAVIYEPAAKDTRPLAAPPPPEFARELVRRGVHKVAIGEVIVACWEPDQDTVFHVIRELELELQVIFNKGAVMVLPSGVNKATGLFAALHELGLSPHNVIGVGDAENDHALLAQCEVGAAVANALPRLKERADIVTGRDHGAGVSELIDRVLANDLEDLAPKLERHKVRLGRAGDQRICIDPYSANIMVCGTSGSGKSTLTTGLLERLCATHYQFGIIDPEGDYSSFEYAVVLGSTKRAPLVEEAIDVLRDEQRNVVVNMLGVAIEHRPEFFTQLMPAISELRSRTGRPHWLVIDEAHHLLPATWEASPDIALRPHGMLYITVHPASVSQNVISTINTVIALGEHPAQTIRDFCDSSGHRCPKFETDKLRPGHALYWRVGDKRAIEIESEPSKQQRTRHSRKYIEGNLGRDRSFYFRGPEQKLNLKAYNLQLFLHIADGIDDDTWLFHLRNGEYSRWFRVEVKDADLADAIERVERDQHLSPRASRDAVRAAVDKRYTLPADVPTGLVDPPSAPNARR
jgi:hydroxymethylpyrimidine pyrophosphatase-like HAD family hydrolase